MAGEMRKLAAEGMYRITGTLDRITGPGRRTVRTLEVLRLAPAASLEPLRAFPDLTRLELGQLDGVNLDLVGDLDLEQLELRNVSGTDLGFLPRLTRLRVLQLNDVSGCAVPSRLRLASTLELLSVIVDAPKITGDTAKDVIAAIEWPGLTRLGALLLSIGQNHNIAPIRVDLGFLATLPALLSLDVFGVEHAGPKPSPLEPPFHGLPKHFERLRIDAWEPEPLIREMERYFGAPREQLGYPSVFERYPYDPSATDWTISYDDDPDGGAWGTYGSLADEDLDPEIETEYEALQIARRRIRHHDPELLARLEFDEEAGGTGITAPTREDLQTALRILGITDP